MLQMQQKGLVLGNFCLANKSVFSAKKSFLLPFFFGLTYSPAVGSGTIAIVLPKGAKILIIDIKID